MKEWWPDRPTAVQRNRHSASVGMVPTFMTSGLPPPCEAEMLGGSLDWRAVALGMQDFGRVRRQGFASLGVFFADYREHLRELF